MPDTETAAAEQDGRTPSSGLRPAAELAAKSAKPYPNDSAAYRKARTALLIEEIELRRQIERVAVQRRALPMGGEARAYEFLDDQGKTVGLTDLFGDHDTLVTYFWMYGPERERPCPMCTSLLGSLDIPAVDLEQRVALAIIGRSPVARQLAFARERGWRNLKFYQCVGDEFPPTIAGLPPTAANGRRWMSGRRRGARCTTSGRANPARPPIQAKTRTARPTRNRYGSFLT